MRAIILAAGRGERLKDITKKVPKPLLKVKGEIILEHNIRWLKKYGIKNFYINIHHLAGKVKNYFKNGERWGVDINYSYEKKILGTAGAIRKIMDDLDKKCRDDDFLVVYGDNFYPLDYNLRDFIDFHFKKKGLATIGLYRKKSEVRKSGVVLLGEDKLVIDFEEKPSPGPARSKAKAGMSKMLKEGLINTGIYAFTKDIYDYIPEGFSDFGKDIFPDLIKKKVPAYGYVFKKPLIAIDTVALFRRASALKAGDRI